MQVKRYLRIDFYIFVAVFCLLSACSSRSLKVKSPNSTSGSSTVNNPASNPTLNSECADALDASLYISTGIYVPTNTDVQFVVEANTNCISKLVSSPGAAPIQFSKSITFIRQFQTAGANSVTVSVQIYDSLGKIAVEKPLRVDFVVLAANASPSPSPTPTPTLSPNAPACTVAVDKNSIYEGEAVSVTLTHLNPAQSGVLTQAKVNGVDILPGTPLSIKPPKGTTAIVANITAANGLTGSCNTPITVKPCAGVAVGGSCWYLATLSASCGGFCGDHGGYDVATATYAGATGTNANCKKVLDSLNAVGTTVTDYANNIVADPSLIIYGLGCGIGTDNLRYRVTVPATTSGSFYAGTRRACACMQ